MLSQDKMKIDSHAILYKYSKVLFFLKKGFTVYIGPLIPLLLLLLLLFTICMQGIYKYITEVDHN